MERWLLAGLIIEVIGIVILFPLLRRKVKERRRLRSETSNRIYRALLARHSPPNSTYRKRHGHFR